MSTVYFKEASKTQNETNNIKAGFMDAWGSGVQGWPWLYCKFQVVLHKTLSQNKAKQKQQYLAAKNILTSWLLEPFWGMTNWKNFLSLEIQNCTLHHNTTFVMSNKLHVPDDRFSHFVQTHSRGFISLKTKAEWSIQVVNYLENYAYAYIWCICMYI